MSVSHLKKKAYRKEAGFYLSRNCAMAVSLQYLLVIMQETVRKGKNAKFARKGTRLLCSYKNEKPEEKLEKSREERDNEQKGLSLCNSEHEFGGNKYVCDACNDKA